jgi:hypothetical protein
MINIIFSYKEEEFLPTLIGFGHNLKSENLCKGEITIINKGTAIIVNKIKTNHKNKEIEIDIKFSVENERAQFMDAHLYIDNTTIKIEEYKRYVSLQIEDWCYDNVYAFRLPYNIFE